MAIKNYDLVIFDCDGTLVDSEYLHNKINSDLLISLGLDEYTPEICIERLAGKSWSNMKPEIKANHGVDVPQDLIDARIPRTLEQMENNPDAVHSIPDALSFVEFANQHCKIAVGSNGEPPTVLKSLQLQSFMNYFAPENIYTKEDVANAKPAPDLFLHIADKLGADPARCLVIEDSVSGAQAGLNAGMDVFGFTGVAHGKKQAESKLKAIGVSYVFDDFIHMQNALKD